jgi:hypothetical protein
MQPNEIMNLAREAVRNGFPISEGDSKYCLFGAAFYQKNKRLYSIKSGDKLFDKVFGLSSRFWHGAVSAFDGEGRKNSDREYIEGYLFGQAARKEFLGSA